MGNEKAVIILKKGDDFFPALQSKLEEKNITSAFLYGVGGLTQAELAVFHSDSKEYTTKSFKEDQLEILSVVGDVSKGPDGKVVIHCHIVLSGNDFRAFGGHLVSATVGATCEIIINPLDHQLTRMFDHRLGIHTIVDS